MKMKIIAAVFLGLFFALAANAQVFLKVDEAQTKATYVENQLKIDLAVENSATNLRANLKLEILDAEENVLGASESTQNLKTGRQLLPVAVAFSQKTDVTELLWKRFRYTLTPENSAASVSNIVSLSEIMPEVFELQVSAPEHIFAGMTLRAHVLAIHPLTEKPIKDVEITGELEIDLDDDSEKDEIAVKARGKTNGDGYATLEFRIPANIKIDECCSDLDIKGEKNGIVREADQDFDEDSRSAFVYLNTDKPIYQPSQKLFVRGLYLDTLRRPVAGKDLDFEIEDERGETVYEGTAKTSRFGVLNIEWQIPASAKLGKYRIELEDDEDLGTAEFKVSRYDLPNFRVSTETDKPFYLPSDETAEISVNASYLFGKPVGGGKVRIVQEKERYWSYEKQRYETDEGEKVEGETSADGTFRARVDLSEEQKSLQESGWTRFKDLKFAAYFTDPTTNRTEQKRFDVRLSKEPIHVYFINQSTVANSRIPFPFYISTFYADGTPAKCDLKIEGNYERSDAIKSLAEGRTNNYGAGKFEIRIPEKPSPDAPDRFEFRVFADDRKGNRTMFAENLYIGATRQQLLVTTDKTVYAPNETIRAKIYSSQTDKTVYFEIVKKTGVIYSQRVKMRNGSADLSVPFRPDFQGEITVAAYTADQTGNGDYLSHSKTLIFPVPNGLNVSVKSLKNSYRPNEDARVSFTARTGENRGQETALGVLILDRAIEERARTEELPDNFASVRKLIGTAEKFGDLTRRDLDNIGTSKPISAELQLAAEFLLAKNPYKPNFLSSGTYQENFAWIYRDYHQKRFKTVESTLRKHFEKTFEYPRDEDSLRKILAAGGVSFDELRDAWNSPYRAEFTTELSNAVVRFSTAGADKNFGTEDDFVAGDFRFEWFRKEQIRLNNAYDNYLQTGKDAPQTPEDLKKIWKDAGIDFDALRDGWNRPLYLQNTQYKRTTQKVYFETIGSLDGSSRQVFKAQNVEQEVIVFKIRSTGADGAQGAYDDFDLAGFTSVLSEKDLSPPRVISNVSRNPNSVASGAIGGTVVDANGAVIPNATVTAINQDSNETISTTSNENGEFILANLPSGIYRVEAQSPYFQKYVIENLVVSSMNLVKLEIMLQVGGVNSVVEVTSTALVTMNSTDTKMSSSVARKEGQSIAANFENNKNSASFTPRVREYFPETLLWQPELITDKSGRAELNFKLGDNLTTWKLYAVGSTATGEISLVEKEFQTFQPFFAELDPPRILTEGDRIALSVPVRNYTDKAQNVAVSIDANNWSRNLNGALQNITIAPNTTQNAIFDLQATAPVTDAKQKVTALAKGDADAIEKPVTVRPNGKEVVETQSNLFEKEAAFDVNFPANAFPNTRRAEVKIYPNMFSHVAESVEGLLKRPYGCGEQTTSSTYPNLMILKIEKDLKQNIAPNIKSQARDYLEEGYKRLLNYQTDTGFGYWSGNEPNAALTAYILRFLHDADEFIKVDETAVEKAEKWLLSQQKADGSWNGDENSTAYILRALSLTGASDAEKRKALESGIRLLKNRLPQIDNAYILANLALAAQNTGDEQTVQASLEKLRTLSMPDKESLYWSTSNTPFYGWGNVANIETTALVLQAFLKSPTRENDEQRAGDNEQISRGLFFLLKNKDRYGVWHSTQTTVNVLDALILLQKSRANGGKNQNDKAEIFVNGKKAQEFSIENSFSNPFIFDAALFLTGGKNRIEIKTSGELNLTMAQIVAKHYINWNDAPADTKYFDLKIEYDKTQAKIGEEITCRVTADRKFNRYGMAIAEIGLPPGADVDRASLEQAKKEERFSNYDVLPDRIVIYFWMSNRPLDVNFKFRSRFGLNAQTAPSVIYDYYNEEARATVAPSRFEVK